MLNPYSLFQTTIAKLVPDPSKVRSHGSCKLGSFGAAGSEVQVSLETELFFRPKKNPTIYQKFFDNNSSVVGCDRQCTIFVVIIFRWLFRKIIKTKIVHCLSQSTTDEWLSKNFWYIVGFCFGRKKVLSRERLELPTPAAPMLPNLQDRRDRTLLGSGTNFGIVVWNRLYAPHRWKVLLKISLGV